MVKKKHITLYALASFMLMLSACSTVTIHPKPIDKVTREANYSQTHHFFFWGLMGETHVDVKSICGDNNVTQMQSQASFVNGLISFASLGIYTPHSAKVWCQDNNDAVTKKEQSV